MERRFILKRGFHDVRRIGMDLISLAVDRDSWQAFVNAAMDLRVYV
jgi:hypothetical protein